VECKIGDIEITFRGKVIVLAAGALSTPELLLKSKSDYWPNGLANSSGYVGLNLMWHVSDIFAIKPKSQMEYMSLKDRYL